MNDEFLPQSYTEESQRYSEIALRLFAAFCGLDKKMKNKMVYKDAQWYVDERIATQR